MAQVELYFSGVDVNSVHLYNPRIELEALHSILSFINKALSSGYHTISGILHDLRDLSVNMIQELGDKFRLESRIVTNYSCDKERSLLLWGESKGVRMTLEVACKSLVYCYLYLPSILRKHVSAKFAFFL